MRREDCRGCEARISTFINQVECINCPPGTVRYPDASDEQLWDGTDTIHAFHEYTIGHCNNTGTNLISSHFIGGRPSSYCSEAFQAYVYAASVACNKNADCDFVSVWCKW